MRKPAFCICKNKDADQLRRYREADQRLCFRYIDSTIHLLSQFQNFKPLAIFCGCTARFVSDLVGNPEDRVSHNEAHISKTEFLMTRFNFPVSSMSVFVIRYLIIKSIKFLFNGALILDRRYEKICFWHM